MLKALMDLRCLNGKYLGVPLDNTDLLFITPEGGPLKVKDMYNSLGYQALGFDPDLRATATDFRRFQSITLLHMSKDTNLSVVVHGHSDNTVLVNYWCDQDNQYQLGTSLIHSDRLKKTTEVTTTAEEPRMQTLRSENSAVVSTRSLEINQMGQNREKLPKLSGVPVRVRTEFNQ